MADYFGGLKKYIKYIREKYPEILAVLLCVGVLLAGVCQKQGYHMDELLSFELSNAQFTPWIVPTQPEGRLAKFVRNEIQGDGFLETLGNLKNTIQDVLANRGSSRMLSYQADVYEEPVWISREQFEDYITVNGSDDFNYLSVYFNVKDDNHPPLHFMLVHTVSSLFKGKITPLMGCSINLAAMAGILVLLIKLGGCYEREFAGKREPEGKVRLTGIMAALAYGLSTGAMASVLLIRMYALLTFFCVAFFHIHVKKWQEKDFGGHNKLLILVTVMGFLTQYFFLFYCILLAAVTAVMLIGGRRYKEFLIYVRSMVTAALTGVLLFPFAVSDVFSSGRGVEALNNLSEGFAGYGERLAVFFQILGGRTFGGSFLLMLVLTGIVLLTLKYRSALWWMLILPVTGYYLLAARMSPYLVDRYIMPIFPFVIFTAVILIFAVSDKLIRVIQEKVPDQGGSSRGQEKGDRGRIWRYLVCAVVLLWQTAGLLGYDGTYLYKGYSLQAAMAREYADCPCICVYEGVGYYENLIEFTSYEKTLLVKPEELAGRKEQESIRELEEVVVLVKAGADFDEAVAVMENIYGFALEELLFRESVYGDRAGVFIKAEG